MELTKLRVRIFNAKSVAIGWRMEICLFNSVILVNIYVPCSLHKPDFDNES